MNKLRLLTLSLLSCATFAQADDLALLQYCESLAQMSSVHISDVKSGIQARIQAETIANANMDAAKASNTTNTQYLNLIKTRADNLLAKTKHFTYANYTLRITGANLNIRHGATAEVADNGLGNLIIGTNDYPAYSKRTGSMNLIIGLQHDWTGRHNFIGGFQAMARGNGNFLLTGYDNESWKSDGVIVTGNSNSTWNDGGFVLTGYQSSASERGVVFTGTGNHASTFGGVALTGEKHNILAEGWNGFIGTGSDCYIAKSGGIGVGKLSAITSDWLWQNTAIK